MPRPISTNQRTRTGGRARRRTALNLGTAEGISTIFPSVATSSLDPRTWLKPSVLSFWGGRSTYRSDHSPNGNVGDSNYPVVPPSDILIRLVTGKLRRLTTCVLWA